eukprot:m.933651 g.933651  ORF g.933651 m.933651 type:complete len:114 (-) comp23796_c0_seq13:1901-2242(-)
MRTHNNEEPMASNLTTKSRVVADQSQHWRVCHTTRHRKYIASCPIRFSVETPASLTCTGPAELFLPAQIADSVPVFHCFLRSHDYFLTAKSWTRRAPHRPRLGTSALTTRRLR